MQVDIPADVPPYFAEYAQSLAEENNRLERIVAAVNEYRLSLPMSDVHIRMGLKERLNLV